jgi:hypothetical protein
MAVLPINTKIRGPAPISCKSPKVRPQGGAIISTGGRKCMGMVNKYCSRDLGVREGKGR